MEAINRGLL